MWCFAAAMGRCLSFGCCVADAGVGVWKEACWGKGEENGGGLRKGGDGAGDWM